jgi:hypothetical protein
MKHVASGVIVQFRLDPSEVELDLYPPSGSAAVRHQHLRQPDKSQPESSCDCATAEPDATCYDSHLLTNRQECPSTLQEGPCLRSDTPLSTGKLLRREPTPRTPG